MVLLITLTHICLLSVFSSFLFTNEVRESLKSLKIWKICKNLSQYPKLTCETETYGFRNDTTLSMTVIDCLATVATVYLMQIYEFRKFSESQMSDFERITNGTSWEIEKNVDLNL